MNKSDSERIASYLEDLGYSETNDKYKAEIVIIVTCGVRQNAEDRVYGFVPRIKKENPDCKIVVTGCLSKRKDVFKRLQEGVDLFLPITDLPRLAEKLSLEMKSEYESDYLKISAKRKSEFSTFVPIGNGCDNYCSYCVVPYARGGEKYRDSDDIIGEVSSLVRNGYKEITLIAQNVNSYHCKDAKGKSMYFPELLGKVSEIEGDFWLHFVTSHPKDVSDELIDVMAKSEKICEHIHLPAQSGNNKILAEMNRKYSIEHYMKLIEKFCKKIPDIIITTDIIVGFPGETRDQFEDTCKLFEDVGYDMAYISQYSPRPGTIAEKMEDSVSRKEKKRREEKLMLILRKTALQNSKSLLGKKIKVLVGGKNKKGEMYGTTRTQKNVKFVGGTDEMIANVIEVEIDNVKDFGISGKAVIDKN